MTCYGECCTGERIESKRLGVKTYTARKEHPCDRCGGKILPGQQYDRMFWLVDGDPYTTKEHINFTECLPPEAAQQEAEK